MKLSKQQLEMFNGCGRGGARKGAGRPKGEASKVVRVPVACLADVKQVIARYHNMKSVTEIKPKEA